MMRQYELVERVKRYNPAADEALLNRAYVYAMHAHGTQKRASGDLYFGHPLEVAAILTDLKLDDATIAAAVLHDTVEDTEATLEEINTTLRAADRRARRRPDQDQAPRPRLEARRAGRELPQAPARDRRRRARAAGQARRPPAQHAHARTSCRPTSASASPRRRSTSTRRSPAAWASRRCATSSRTWPSATSTRRPTRRSAAACASSRRRASELVEEIERT